MEQPMKWYAAHTVTASHGTWKMAAVAIQDGEVIGLRQIIGEPPNTMWLGGTILLKRADNGKMTAYHVDSDKWLK
ncbi:MAG: hypothetical protein IKT00_14040 [Prevotella sp.]|nr:hypothetical protein [Prevotella sp.]